MPKDFAHFWKYLEESRAERRRRASTSLKTALCIYWLDFEGGPDISRRWNEHLFELWSRKQEYLQQLTRLALDTSSTTCAWVARAISGLLVESRSLIHQNLLLPAELAKVTRTWRI